MRIWPTGSEVLVTIPESSVDITDRVLTVSKHTRPPSSLVLRMQKDNGVEYGMVVRMPVSLVRKASQVIKAGLSLHEIAKLDFNNAKKGTPRKVSN